MIRLQKALADRGVASRRRAEELITGGRVRVDGEPVTALGTKVAPDARIDVDGVPTVTTAPRYVLLNKPRGIVSTAHDDRGRRTVVDLIGATERMYPVGRLDTDSEGMLLLTNDGEWAQRVIHPRFGHEREYDVAVQGEITPAVLAQLHNGVRLEEGLAVATRIDVRSRSRRESHLRIVLHTGWRRQVRRMLSAVGLRTVRLIRVRIGPLQLGRLRSGDWRELTPKEIADLARPSEHAATSAPRARRPSAAPAQPSPRAAAPRSPRPPRAARSVGSSRTPGTAPSRGTRLGTSIEGRREATRAQGRPRTPWAPPKSRADAAPRAPAPRGTPRRPRRGVRGVERVSAQRPPVRGPAAPRARAAGPTARRLVPGRRPRPYGTTRGPVRARVAPR